MQILKRVFRKLSQVSRKETSVRTTETPNPENSNILSTGRGFYLKKPAKLKILFYGNCQVDVVHHALKFSNPNSEFEYAGNSRRVDRFDEGRKNELLKWCDHIISQPIMNTENPDYYENMLQIHGDKISFMPYIFLDGVFSMSHAPGSVGSTISGVIGQEPVRDMVLEQGFDETLTQFRAGKIHFKHKERLKYNFEEMDRRDAICHAKVMPFIRSGSVAQIS